MPRDAWTRSPGTIGNTDVLSHDYTLDARGRRTAAAREDGTHLDYGYNDRGEVTAHKMPLILRSISFKWLIINFFARLQRGSLNLGMAFGGYKQAAFIALSGCA